MSGKLVLCVDDEPSGLLLRKMLLESAGYSVLTAEDGPSALELFGANDVDAVVLDYAMPGMNGDVVGKRMRQLKPRIPLLLLTAFLDLPEQTRAPFDTFLTKGDAPGVLFREMDRLIHASHAHSEWEGEYVAFAGPDRQYTEVTEGLAKLLGYSREQLLQMRIDDVVEVPEVVPDLWESYVEKGYQEGTIQLKGRTGTRHRVRYRAKVFPDGCMLSRIEPM